MWCYSNGIVLRSSAGVDCFKEKISKSVLCIGSYVVLHGIYVRPFCIVYLQS